jgi:hypothetical protein
MHGHISNAQEMRELYGLPSGDLVPFASVYNPVDNMLMPPPPPAPPSIEAGAYTRSLQSSTSAPSEHIAHV